MEEIPEVYARSLFEVAKEHGILDRVRDELGEFAEALETDRDLRLFFFAPYFSSEEKRDAVDRVVVDADPRVVNFLKLLAERHRMPVLSRIRRAYDALWAEENKLLPVTVTSAVELDEGLVQGIGRGIEGQNDRGGGRSSAVDPALLGGLVVRGGNLVLDASIRNRLEQLRKQVAKA